MAELLTLGNNRRPVTQALAVLDVTTLMSSVVSRPATSAMLGQVATAMWQILATGTPEQQAKAREAVSELRRKLYGILADEGQDDERDQT